MMYFVLLSVFAAAAVLACLVAMAVDRWFLEQQSVPVTIASKEHIAPEYDPVATYYHHVNTQAYDEGMYTFERFRLRVKDGFGRESIVDVDRSVFEKVAEGGAARLIYKVGRWSKARIPVTVALSNGGGPP